MNRLDGRNNIDVRPIRISKNVIQSALSSIQMSIGCTSVIVAIYKKPNSHPKKKLELEIETLDSMDISEILNLSKISTDLMFREVLKLLPEYELIINIFIIENDGNLLTVLLNALSQTLKEIKTFEFTELIFSSASIDCRKKEIYLDPTKFEQQSLHQELVYAMVFDLKNKKLKFYQIMKSIVENESIIGLNTQKIQKLVIELGFYFFKIFN